MDKNISDKKFLVQSFSWVALANIITKPLWFLLFILAARLLGTEQFGIYTYASSMVMLANLFIDFGFDYAAVREIAQNKEKSLSYFTSIMTARVLVTTFALIIFVILYSLGIIADFFELIVIIVILLYQFTLVFLQFLKNLTTAFFNYKMFSQITLFEKFSIVIFGVMAVLFTKNLLWFLIAIVFSNVLTLGIFYRVVYSILNSERQNWTFDFKEVKKITKETLPIFYISLFVTLYFRTDIIIMKYIGLEHSLIGVYGALHRLIEMYLMVPTIIMATAFPILSNSFKDNIKFSREFLSKTLQILLLVSLPICLIISLNFSYFNSILFGQEYSRGALGLAIIIWTTIPIGLNYALGNVLVIIKKESISTFTLLTISLISVFLNVVLIPVYGIIVSCILTMVLEYLIMLSYSFYVKKYFGDFKFLSLLLKSFLVVVFTVIVHIGVLKIISYNLIVFFIIDVFSIITLLFSSKLIEINEIKSLIETIISRKNNQIG